VIKTATARRRSPPRLHGSVPHPETLGNARWPLSGNAPVLAGDFDGDRATEVLVRQPAAGNRVSLGLLHGTSIPPWQSIPYWGPAGVTLTAVSEEITSGNRTRLRDAVRDAYVATAAGCEYALWKSTPIEYITATSFVKTCLHERA